MNKKKLLIKFFDKLVLLILGMFGLLSACEPVAEYGTPNADYQLKGTITDSVTTRTIPNIRVIRKNPENPYFADTTFTDAYGKYSYKFNEFAYQHPQFILKVEDIDGTQNSGDFSSREIKISINEVDWVSNGDDNWYYGKAIKTTDVKLQLKK